MIYLTQILIFLDTGIHADLEKSCALVYEYQSWATRDGVLGDADYK